MYLFIGGDADGQRISIPDKVSTYRVPHRSGYDEYWLTQLAGNSQRFSVYALKGMTGDEVMQRLINSYNPVFSREKAVSA